MRKIVNKSEKWFIFYEEISGNFWKEDSWIIVKKEKEEKGKMGGGWEWDGLGFGMVTMQFWGW